MDKLEFLVNKALSRRGFVAGAGSAAAASVLAGCSDGGTVNLPSVSTAYTDVDILNFALNLEYLEAEFYLRAATGNGLATADLGSSPGAITANVPTGASSFKITTQANGTPITAAQQNLLNEIAYTEQQHVRFLRSAITNFGGTPISRPALDYVNSVAKVATLASLPTGFNPFMNLDAFVGMAAIFEDIGVTAYNGAAPLISQTSTGKLILAASAGILAVEAYHGATLRTLIYANAALQGTASYPYLGYFNSIQNVVSTLSGGYGTLNLQLQGTTAITTTGIGAANTVPNIIPADSNALAFHRTTDQVLHIAYGTAATTQGAGLSSGGFFPSGFNGNIKVTAS